MFEDREILRILRETHQLLCKFFELFLKFNRILGGEMTQIGDDPMVTVSAGNSPQYGVVPTPSGVSTFAAQTVWSSSDTTNAPVTMNASDASGLTATVTIASTAPVGTAFTLTWTYTNADGTVVTVTLAQTTVAPVIDVTGGTMSQIA